jgi:hypothetical protein
MSDWLALHGVTAGQVLALLGAGPADGPVRATDSPQAGPPPWPMVLTALAQALPAATPMLDRIAREGKILLHPSPTLGSRPFTLHDDGSGLPLIHCPLTGRLSDLIRLAHELGHVCQILASGPANPMVREVAACLSERLVVGALAGHLPDLLALHAARDRRATARSAASLRAALADPVCPYHNDWNYAPARLIARRAVDALPRDALWPLICGARTMPELLALV